MKKLFLLVSLMTLFIVTSCSSDSDDDSPVITIPPGEITYTNTIKAIIDNNCIGCHSSPPANGAPMSLINLSEVKSAIENRNLIGRIENGTMPPNGSLSATQIQNIKSWQTNGFK